MPDLNTYNMTKELGAKKDTLGAVFVNTATTTQLTDKSHAINTTGKYVGKLVFNTTTGALVAAAAASATGAWNNVGTGASAHAPA